MRIHVDVAGYRAKRRAALADFTRNLAEKVLETGRAQALEPMSASDRKVVHDTASEIDGITINGVDLIAWNADGLITHFKVMVRPLKAINILHQKMGEYLVSVGAVKLK